MIGAAAVAATMGALLLAPVGFPQPFQTFTGHRVEPDEAVIIVQSGARIERKLARMFASENIRICNNGLNVDVLAHAMKNVLSRDAVQFNDDLWCLPRIDQAKVMSEGVYNRLSGSRAAVHPFMRGARDNIQSGSLSEVFQLDEDSRRVLPKIDDTALARPDIGAQLSFRMALTAVPQFIGRVPKQGRRSEQERSEKTNKGPFVMVHESNSRAEQGQRRADDWAGFIAFGLLCVPAIAALMGRWGLYVFLGWAIFMMLGLSLSTIAGLI